MSLKTEWETHQKQQMALLITSYRNLSEIPICTLLPIWSSSIYIPLPFNPASPQLMTSFKWNFGCLTRHQFEIIFIFFYKKGIGKSSDLCPLFCSYIKHIVDQYWAPIVAIYPLLLVNNQPTYKSMLGVWLGNQTTFH